MIISLSGKGGTGKTTIAAMLIDELARLGYAGRILTIDADPAMALALTLDVEPPPVTLADIRDSTPLNARLIKQLPARTSPADFVYSKLVSEGVIAHRRIRNLDNILTILIGNQIGAFRIEASIKKLAKTWLKV